MNITNGTTDVEPALKEIVIRFTRPMFTIAVALEPDKEYGFSLNEPGLDVFQSVEGIPLSPVKVQFRTRPAH